jgi:hypothetical protein
VLKSRIDEKSIRKTIKELHEIRKSALPQAVRRTLNDLAFYTRKEAQRQVEKDFTLRNKFTAKRIVVNRAKQFSIKDMRSEVGHTEEYMRIQEVGGVVKGKGRHKPIPTKETRISRSSQKMVRKMYRMGQMQFGNNVFATKIRRKKGVFLRKGKGRRKKIVMLYNLEKTEVKIQKRPWLRPARNKVTTKHNFARIFNKNVVYLRKKYS